jgi:hypothetical protein
MIAPLTGRKTPPRLASRRNVPQAWQFLDATKSLEGDINLKTEMIN